MEPFIGEIRIFAGSFAPRGWALCNGQLIAIQQNTALFSILGTAYGGNGQTTFGLPNLQMRAPMRFGTGPGLTPRTQGEAGGSETMTLLNTQMPTHSHIVRGTPDQVSQTTPVNTLPGSAAGGRGQQGPAMYASASGTTPVTLAPATVGVAGGSFPISKMKPILAINYIICMQGVFPPRQE